MFLLESNYFGIRNLESKKLEFSPKINFFYGKNGQGKTSILEAIYFSVSGKSFRSKKTKEIITFNKNNCGVLSTYKDKINEKKIGVKYNGSKKEFLFNEKLVSYDEFLGKMNIISFIPEDIALLIGPPSSRRSFFDYEISQTNPLYYSYLKDFSKMLKLRNKILKSKKINNELFKIYNEKFIDLGSKLIMKRYEYVKDLSRLLNLNYRKLFDKSSELKLIYRSDLGSFDKLKLEEIKESLKEALEKNIKKDIYNGYSGFGPQRDDYEFSLSNKDAKNFSSQGEKKSIIFALKLSQIDMVIKDKKEYPVFLIDDISSYFDSIRKESILDYFNKKNIQVFITSTEKIDIDASFFYVKEGNVV